jgi:restriction endonuclease Mrr
MNEPVPADTVPGHQSLTLPVLKAAVGEQRIGAVAPSLGAKLEMGEAARATLLASGRQTIFANRGHWAKTYLAKAGPAEATRRCHFCLPSPSPMFGSFVVDQKRRPETTPGSDCSK